MFELRLARLMRALIMERDTTQKHLFFFTRDEKIEFIEGDTWETIAQTAQGLSGGPYFEILSITEDHRFITGGHDEYEGNISDDALGKAIDDAKAARELFYKDRAEEFGSTAYPKGAAAGK